MAEERVYKTTAAQRQATAKRMAKMASLTIWLKPEEKDALRRGETEFFRADHGLVGIARHLNGKTIRCYVNRSSHSWEIRENNVLLQHNTEAVAPGWLSVAPMGFCITEDA